MSPAVPIEPPLSESGPFSLTPLPPRRPFAHLRGVQWRIDLGILPSSSSSIDDLRRVTADSRRRYATLRRHLLIDPHMPKDGSNSPDLVMDNPLSQNPESMWGRFFRNAELERMVDQDLSRLYPEHGSYFQTAGCQGMLRRILLLWCLRHPECGYRQGMHELLAPLLYVLHVDVEHFFEVRRLHEGHFIDKFDGFSSHESDLTYKSDFKKFSESSVDEIYALISPAVSELDPKTQAKTQAIVLLSDAYGAEGELGIVMSEKFMEHDAYCMFDALMSGAGGAVAMAEFFSPSPSGSSHSGFPPVLEASSALYHLLSVVDSSLHSHLVELGVEPQYFALRWLRVLFGREFVLEDLLIIWDEIFASDNCNITKCGENDAEAAFGVLNSSRGAYISAIAVSMILYLRSSLLATENATSCLQKLLNFPEEANLEKLIAKAKSLQVLALDTNNSTPLPTHIGPDNGSSSVAVRGHSLSLDSISPGTVFTLVPECYWEKKWRVLHKEENHKQGSLVKQVPNCIKGWSEKVRLHLSRTESDPTPSDIADRKKKANSSSARRSLLDDLAQQLGSDENTENLVVSEDLGQKDMAEAEGKETGCNSITCQNEGGCLNENTGSEENSSIFSDPASPTNELNDHDNESGSSIESNSSIDENDEDSIIAMSGRDDLESSPLPISDSPENFTSDSKHHDDSNAKSAVENSKHHDSNSKSVAGLKEQKPSGKFQWFWKFGRNTGEGISERGGGSEATRASSSGCNRNAAGSPVADGNSSSAISKGEDAMDQNMMVSLRNLGQSMLENIQVLESVFQQDRGQVSALDNLSKNALVGRGQTTAMTALKELRKISNLLSEM